MSRRPTRRPASTLLRPEQKVKPPGMLERLYHGAKWQGNRLLPSRAFIHRRLLGGIHRYGELFSGMSDSELQDARKVLQTKLHREGLTDALLSETFALIRETAGRSLGMYHFDAQLLAGLALIEGCVAEMQTGEGKTLTATLPAAAAALAGIPVHVITVNDYLARRDAELMLPVYQALGLSVGCVVQGLSQEEKKKAYACDIVYCTNKDVVFDYLRDQLVLKDNQSPLHLHGGRLTGKASIDESLLLRGLHFAIVDEADSVLLDEARSPLVISGGKGASPEQQQVLSKAMALVSEMVLDRDFKLDLKQRSVQLTPEGETWLKEQTRHAGSYWSGKVRREDIIHKALTARCLLEKDHHYLVRDGKVQIIDEHTGRIMADRSWEQDLHQLVEIKEGCELTAVRDTLARMTYQRFFRQYHHLAGMTGTAHEVSGELWSVYGLPVMPIPTHRPSRRLYSAPRYFPTQHEKWQAVLDSIRRMHNLGRSVLVGVASVAVAEQLSELLLQEGLEHQVLSAVNDQHEADIVAQAGLPGQITVATQMAGRGTDIKLAPVVEEAGGLHVILTEYHDASRIDRQLAGRCARQGDPGSFEVLVSGEDSLLEGKTFMGMRKLVLSVTFTPFSERLGLARLKWTQKQVERRHASIRRQLFQSDEKQDERLSFTGSG